MPQKYIPQPGSKNIQKAYKDLDRTIQAVNGDTSVHDAAKRFGIARTILQHRIKGHVNPHGRQTILQNYEEHMLVSRVKVCSDWGFPFDATDLRMLVKGYLDKKGVIVP